MPHPANGGDSSADEAALLAAKARTAERNLRVVTDALPLLVSFVTADERYGYVNRAYEEWFGIPADQLVGRTVREVIGEKAYAVLSPHVRRGLAGESFAFEQYDVPYRLGGTRDVKVSFIAHREPDGRVDGYTALLEDITLQRRLQAERDALASYVGEILETTDDGFFSMDRDWRILMVNRAQEISSGKPREETLGHIFWEAFPTAADPESLYWSEYRRCMEERVPVHFSAHYAPLSMWTDVKAFPTTTGGVAVFYRDITRQKHTEEVLKRQAEFERQLIGIVSHDLRTPLQTILLGTHVLLHRDGQDAPSLKTLVRIQSAAERSSRMISDLLDFTQARVGGGIRIVPVPGNLHVAVRQVADEVTATSGERVIKVRVSGDGHGVWDMDRLGQVLLNLVSNAVKYSPPASTVEVVSSGDDKGVMISVHNSGPPIADSELKRIFQPMQRATSQLENSARSVGLGLFIVKHLVDAHGGTVSVSSSEEAGTTFAFRVPRQPGPTKVE